MVETQQSFSSKGHYAHGQDMTEVVETLSDVAASLVAKTKSQPREILKQCFLSKAESQPHCTLDSHITFVSAPPNFFQGPTLGTQVGFSGYDFGRDPNMKVGFLGLFGTRRPSEEEPR